MKIQGGLVIATNYAVDNYDRERMKSLMNPVSEKPTSPKQDEGVKKNDYGRPPEQCNEGGEIAEVSNEAPKVNLGEANFGQLSPNEKDTSMGILNEYIVVFAANRKSVPACKGVPMRLELKDPNVKPYVAPIRHYSQEQREMIQTEVVKLLKNESIRESTCEWAANCSTVRKKDGTVRVLQDFRGINALLKSQSGGLGELQYIIDEMEGLKYFSSIDLASGFLQLEIHEDDRHLTAFRDADGKLYEYVRCGFGLKTVPSVFANYVEGRLLTVRDIKDWLDDIAIPSKTLQGQWGLLRETLECGKDV